MRIIRPNQTGTQSTFGLVAWLESTRVVLPLKAVECSFQVCGDLLSVQMDQIFHQSNRTAVDCLYTFPLPAGAAVYCCEMHVNGRVIRARVEEREAARALASKMKAAGHRTGLVEMERDNLFTLSLGNLQPDDLAVIRLKYFQTLTRLAEWTSFTLPLCPGVRYIPGVPLLRSNKGRGTVDDTDQVPDASRISPPRIDAFHPDAARVSIEGVVEHPLEDVRDISSPSHPVLVREAPGSSDVRLADRGSVPDRDFVLRWSEEQIEKPKPVGWVYQSGAEAYALVSLRAPANAATSEHYAQDIYFLIDRSGSMAGLKWQKAVQAFQSFLQTLGARDRVWATFFETEVRDFSESPLPARDIAADPQLQNIESLGTCGGTELLPAIKHVLQKIQTHSPGRTANLVLITDGQIGNEAQILDCLRSRADLRVHVFGIDTTLNDGFLQKLAAQNHGTACLLSPRDDIPGAVRRLGDRLHRPVLTSIRASEGWQPAGEGIPDLYAGEVLTIPLRGIGTTLVLEARLPEGQAQSYPFKLAETSTPAPRLLWSKRRMDLLIAHGKTADAIALGKESNLVCEGAAFVAWDEVEKVPVSLPEQEIYQPAMLGSTELYSNFRTNAIHARSAMPSASSFLQLLDPIRNDPAFASRAGKKLLKELGSWLDGFAFGSEKGIFTAFLELTIVLKRAGNGKFVTALTTWFNSHRDVLPKELIILFERFLAEVKTPVTEGNKERTP